MADANIGQRITLYARVFRKGPKPKLIPNALWRWAARRRIPGTGRGEEMRKVASSEDGNIINNKRI